MLKLQKETLAELSTSDLANVVGGYAVSAVGGATTCFIVHYPESCVVASCITND